jgi:glucokinase
MKCYIGVDLGGTNVRCAKITEKGEILAQVKGPSFGLEGPEKVMGNIKDLIHQLPNVEEASGIGICVPGPVDKKTNTMSLSTNLPGFTGYPMGDELEKEFGLPTFLDNDANCAGLAEALVGAGKGLKTVFYVTISTGIGGVLVVDGKTVSGKHGFGGEIANMVIDRNREKVNYLNVGAVENEASGTAITRKGQAAIHDVEIKHAGSVFKLAKEGRKEAVEISNTACEDLGMMFATIATVCDPDMFIVGGGMTKSASVFMPKVIDNFKKYSHEALHDTEFKLAELEEPGIIGAAMIPLSEGK